MRLAGRRVQSHDVQVAQIVDVPASQLDDTLDGASSRTGFVGARYVSHGIGGGLDAGRDIVVDHAVCRAGLSGRCHVILLASLARCFLITASRRIMTGELGRTEKQRISHAHSAFLVPSGAAASSNSVGDGESLRTVCSVARAALLSGSGPASSFAECSGCCMLFIDMVPYPSCPSCPPRSALFWGGMGVKATGRGRHYD